MFSRAVTISCGHTVHKGETCREKQYNLDKFYRARFSAGLYRFARFQIPRCDVRGITLRVYCVRHKDSSSSFATILCTFREPAVANIRISSVAAQQIKSIISKVCIFISLFVYPSGCYKYDISNKDGTKYDFI